MSEPRANALFVIHPYRSVDLWVFDDAHVNLIAEPFVLGMSEMLDVMVGDETVERFTLIFSPLPFPGYQAELDWLREESGGNWYLWKARNMEGWLCPALFKYFEKAPPRIYCKAESLLKGTTAQASPRSAQHD